MKSWFWQKKDGKVLSYQLQKWYIGNNEYVCSIIAFLKRILNLALFLTIIIFIYPTIYAIILIVSRKETT